LFYFLGVFDLPLICSGYGSYLLNGNNTLLYPNEINVSNKVYFDKRTTEQRFVNIDAVKVDIKDYKEDIQIYYVQNTPDIERKLLEEKEYRIIDRQEAKQKEAERLAKMSKKRRAVTTTASTLDQDKERNRLFAENTIFTDDLFKILYESGYIDTVNRIFQDNNNTIYLQAKIRKIDEYVITEGWQSYRKLGLDISWLTYNHFDEVVDSVSFYSFSDPFVSEGFNDVNYVEMINDVLTQSYFELKQTAAFQERLKVQTDFSIKESTLSLIKPKNTVKELSDAALASVIIKRADGGHGSGFAITQDGYILTNYHVVAGKIEGQPSTFKVVLANGIQLDGKIVRFNKARDLALLKIEYNFEKAFLLSEVKSFKNLSEVYTIGAPKSVELGQSVSLGLISNERVVNNNNLLQVNININGGNSGGPLFEKNGILQGVIQSKLIGKDTEGVGFAIPSYLVPSYLNINYSK
jgi:S1-C subfamily serine protease